MLMARCKVYNYQVDVSFFPTSDKRETQINTAKQGRGRVSAYSTRRSYATSRSRTKRCIFNPATFAIPRSNEKPHKNLVCIKQNPFSVCLWRKRSIKHKLVIIGDFTDLLTSVDGTKHWSEGGRDVKWATFVTRTVQSLQLKWAYNSDSEVHTVLHTTMAPLKNVNLAPNKTGKDVLCMCRFRVQTSSFNNRCGIISVRDASREQMWWVLTMVSQICSL